MSKVGLQNFLRGFAATAAGYQQGSILADQERQRREQEDYERRLRAQEYQRRLLESERDYGVQLDRISYQKQRDTALDARERAREAQDLRQQEATIFASQYPEADPQLIRGILRGAPESSYTAPPYPIMSPVGGTIMPPASGAAGVARMRGRSRAQITDEARREAIDARRDLAENAVEARRTNAEARERQKAQDQNAQIMARVQQATLRKDPAALVSALREQHDFARQNARFGIVPHEADRWDFEPRASTAQVPAARMVAPGLAMLPPVAQAGAIAGLHGQTVPVQGMEAPEEAHVRNLRAAGEDLGVDKKAAQEGMRRLEAVFRSGAFARMPVADQERILALWGDLGETSGIPRFALPGVNLEELPPQTRAMVEQRKLDREQRVLDRQQRERHHLDRANLEKQSGKEAELNARTLLARVSSELAAESKKRLLDRNPDLVATLTEQKAWLKDFLFGRIGGPTVAAGQPASGQPNNARAVVLAEIALFEKQVSRRATATERNNLSRAVRARLGVR